MSHEIRTPMPALSGMLNLLDRNKHLPSQEVSLNAMQLNTDNLIVSLNDIHDIFIIETRKIEIESISLKPSSDLEHVMQILKSKAEK